MNSKSSSKYQKVLEHEGKSVNSLTVKSNLNVIEHPNTVRYIFLKKLDKTNQENENSVRKKILNKVSFCQKQSSQKWIK